MAAFLGTRQLPTHASSCPFHVPCSVHTRPVIAGGFQLPALHQQLGSLAGPQIAARASGCSRVGRTQLKTQAGLFGNLGNIFNKDGAKVRRQMQPMVDKVNALEAEMQSLTDEQLKSKTDEFKQRLQKGQSLDDLLVEAFAVSHPHAYAKSQHSAMMHKVSLDQGLPILKSFATDMAVGFMGTKSSRSTPV